MKRHHLAITFILCIILHSFNSIGQEIFVTANTNLCPNCYNQFRMLDEIEASIPLHLVFMQGNRTEARRFADKFFHVNRDYDILCDDSLYHQLTHNIYPWLYLYKNDTLIFDAALEHHEQWVPIIQQLIAEKSTGTAINKLPNNISITDDSRCIALNDNYLFFDFTFNELILLDKNFNHVRTQDFATADFPTLYHNIFKDEKTWQNVSRYAKEISPYIPDFGKIKIDNGCVFNDTVFLLVNVNYTETYFNEKRQDSAVKVLNESAIIGLDKQLNIQSVYPLRFRDSLRFDSFMVNAFANCVFQINDWDNIVLSISQKESDEKHILCKMRKDNGEIKFKSLVDKAFIPEFNEKHQLGTKLCLIKIDEHNTYFNAAPIITNYGNGRQLGLPFQNESAHFDLKNGIAKADYILADAIQTTTGDYILYYYFQSKSKLSLIDASGNLVWTIHLPDECKKLYLINEKTALFIDKNHRIVNLFR